MSEVPPTVEVEEQHLKRLVKLADSYASEAEEAGAETYATETREWLDGIVGKYDIDHPKRRDDDV